MRADMVRLEMAVKAMEAGNAEVAARLRTLRILIDTVPLGTQSSEQIRAAKTELARIQEALAQISRHVRL